MDKKVSCQENSMQLNPVLIKIGTMKLFPLTLEGHLKSMIFHAVNGINKAKDTDTSNALFPINTVCDSLILQNYLWFY